MPCISRKWHCLSKLWRTTELNIFPHSIGYASSKVLHTNIWAFLQQDTSIENLKRFHAAGLTPHFETLESVTALKSMVSWWIPFAIVVQSLSHVWLFVIPLTAACQASLSFTISQSLLKLMSLNRWCHPTISSTVIPFSACLWSFPSPGSFPMSWLSASGDPSIEASVSASVLPMNFQGWFLLGLTGLISLQSK